MRLRMLQLLVKWGGVGALIGAAIGFFFYQKTPPQFESQVIIGFKLLPGVTDRTQGYSKIRPSEVIFQSEVLSPAIQLAGLDSQGGVHSLSDSSVEAFLADNPLSVEILSNTSDGETLRVSFQNGLPSRCQNFMSGFIESMTTHFRVETAEPVTKEGTTEWMSVKAHSDSRILQLKAKLIELPSNPEVRWTEQGLVSPTMLKWDALQTEADQLHRRKAMLRERLIELRAIPLAKEGAEEAVASVESFSGSQESGFVEANGIPKPVKERVTGLPGGSHDGRSDDLDNGGGGKAEIQEDGDLTAAEITLRIDYLQKQIDLIFEQHLLISQNMRALAREIDLEEQVAFEVYTLRKEIEQEFMIRDRLFGKPVASPSQQQAFPFELDVVGIPTSPVQVEPRLAFHLWLGAAVGASLLMMMTGFVLAVGLEETR
ncbi:MAG: hypothetical protein ACPHL6_04875 [Rubripirellula sp.]